MQKLSKTFTNNLRIQKKKLTEDYNKENTYK